jgi:modulator of FtsH protease
MAYIEPVRNVRSRLTAGAYDPDVARMLRNTYMLLSLSLLPAIGGAALGVMYNPFALVGPIPCLILFMVVLFGLQHVIVRNSNSLAGVGWLQVFTLSMGYFFGPTIALALSFSNGFDLIFLAVGGTAAIFFSMAFLGSVVKRNLGTPSMMSVLIIGMFMAFFLGIANFFLQIPALHLAISTVFLVLSSGFIMLTVNRIVNRGERNYITATLTLFIMILNVFSSLLHLLMAFAGNRD